MADLCQRLEIERIGFYENGKSKLTVETLFKSVMRVIDFVFAVVVMVVAMVPKIIDQMAHRMKGMTEYREQYRKA